MADAIEPVQPDALVPFAIGEEGARSAFSDWIAHRWFAPRSLKAEGARIDAVEGLFLPFWSFSAQTHSTYVGRRGEIRHRQVMRTRTDAEGKSETHWETETETEWHHVAGQVSRHFEGLIRPACAPLAEKVPQWTLTGLRPYAQGSADGKRVIVYDVDPVSGFAEAKDLMRAQIDSDVRQDIGGNSQRVSDVTTTYSGESCSLLLQPAWLISYTHRGRTWSALVNGASGEMAGERPYSGAKISLLVAVLAAAAAAAVLLALLR
ncbi:MAG TPA: hypothetical protein VFN97_02455 [Actinospica sp.]|nr:hypothetical protein [Actinospica sp.]